MEDLTTTTEQVLLFEEDVQLTDFVEYGFSLQDLVEGKLPIPSEGARFDIHFEGELVGERIKGRIKGVDYLEVRADGRFFLNLQAMIRTDDGATIKVVETGINNRGDLRLNMEFHTNDQHYKWLNHTQVQGVGMADFNSGIAKVKGFLI